MKFRQSYSYLRYFWEITARNIPAGSGAQKRTAHEEKSVGLTKNGVDSWVQHQNGVDSWVQHQNGVVSVLLPQFSSPSNWQSGVTHVMRVASALKKWRLKLVPILHVNLISFYLLRSKQVKVWCIYFFFSLFSHFLIFLHQFLILGDIDHMTILNQKTSKIQITSIEQKTRINKKTSTNQKTSKNT